ncbi:MULTISPECIES: HAD family hydrolase [Falsihalocynthiibacter]|uniref:HAD family hydrolase n=1 Tax=Falsihalocynthiibacter TaxID=2854182 RepID=UPI0030023012
MSFQSTDTTRPIDLVIFDCDGVLIDSEALSANVLTAVLKEEGIVIDLPYFRRHFLGRSFSTVVKAIDAGFGVVVPQDFEARYTSRLLAGFELNLKTTEGVLEILAALKVPFCVATSSSPKRVARSLEVVGLSGHFDGVVFTASEVKNGKPAPDLFLHAANKMGVDPARCLVIEDSLPGVAAGLAAQMDVVRFLGGAHFAGRLPAVVENVDVFDKWSKLVELRPSLLKGSAR